MAAAFGQSESYKGETHKSTRQGTGSYEYNNKFFKYEGQWKNGKKHGTGKLVFTDGSYYEGTFQNGEIEGFGTRYFSASGCKYQGQFQHGELQGKGRMTWPDGCIYEGQWEKNKRQGFGVFKSVGEDYMYKGYYHVNKRHGHGTMVYPKGDRFDGDWNMDMRNGYGEMKYLDGSIYEGQFQDDKFCGNGTMRHCSGWLYQGTWKDGIPSVLATKLVIVSPMGDAVDTLEIFQGHPFDIKVHCVSDDGIVVKEESGRNLRIAAGFKHMKPKKGTALFDLIEEYEEKPMETPYYEVLQYPLTELLEEVVEDLHREEEIKEEPDETLEQYTDKENPAVVNQTDAMKEAVTKEDTQSETQEKQVASVQPISDAPLLDIESKPTPPLMASKKSEDGVCEWKNIQLAISPPRFPPFVVLDEEERKLKARQQKQGETKRLSVIAHDESYARAGEYVIMVHDVTSPPFMDQVLKPAFLLVNLKKPKHDKKLKDVKPKWDTTKHIVQNMVRT